VVTNKAYLPLIGGSEVDFETELIGSTFRLFNNPNAASGCGCGISFELK
jgi:Fe-S cluster assembly iron-binding protein IscA